MTGGAHSDAATGTSSIPSVHGCGCRACVHMRVCVCKYADLCNGFRHPSRELRIWNNKATHSFISPSAGGAQRGTDKAADLGEKTVLSGHVGGGVLGREGSRKGNHDSNTQTAKLGPTLIL